MEIGELLLSRLVHLADRVQHIVGTRSELRAKRTILFHGLGQEAPGAVAHVVGAELINAVSPPTALSIKWGFPQYIKLIADAAKAAGK